MGYGADELVALEEVVTPDPVEEPVAVAVEDLVDEESEPDEVASKIRSVILHSTIPWAGYNLQTVLPAEAQVSL